MSMRSQYDIMDVVEALPGIDMVDLDAVLASGVRLAGWDERCPGDRDLLMSRPPHWQFQPVAVAAGGYWAMIHHRMREPDVLWMSDIPAPLEGRSDDDPDPRPLMRRPVETPSDAFIRRRLLVVLPWPVLARYLARSAPARLDPSLPGAIQSIELRLDPLRVAGGGQPAGEVRKMVEAMLADAFEPPYPPIVRWGAAGGAEWLTVNGEKVGINDRSDLAPVEAVRQFVCAKLEDIWHTINRSVNGRER